MELKINKDFLVRHIFAFLVFAILGGWFGFDAFVRYPNATGHDLYVSIEGSEPPANVNLEEFKHQKVMTQIVLSLVTLTASAVVGLHLLAVILFRFSCDSEGFVHKGIRRKWSDVKSVDKSLWEMKRIVVLSGDGWRIKLDGWHHIPVADVLEYLTAPPES